MEGDADGGPPASPVSVDYAVEVPDEIVDLKRPTPSQKGRIYCEDVKIAIFLLFCVGAIVAFFFFLWRNSPVVTIVLVVVFVLAMCCAAKYYAASYGGR